MGRLYFSYFLTKKAARIPITEIYFPMNKPLIINRLAFLFCLFPIFLFGQNTTCADALVIGAGEYRIASFSGDGAIFQGATAAAWYRFEPTERGVFSISSCEGEGDSRLVLMLLDDCSKPNEFQIINSADDNCSDGKGGETASFIESVAIPGFSYVIYWDNGQSEDGFTWNLTFTVEDEVAEGSTCEMAQEISVGTHQVDELKGTGAAFSDAVGAKWYAFTSREEGVLTISACESAINTRLFVFEGTCENPQIFTQNDDGCGESGASILGEDAIIAQDTRYLIYWDDHWSKDGFSFDLNVSDIPSDVQEPEWAVNIDLFPNPVDNQLYVDYNFDRNLDLIAGVYNNFGQLLVRENWTAFQNGQVTINVANFPKGFYFLRLSAANGQMTRKFVIKRQN